MKSPQLFVMFFLVAGALSACSDRTDMASPSCAALATGKLSDAQQVELAKKCPRAGPSFKPSPARNW